MIATKPPMKRKIQDDELSSESENPSKLRKVEKVQNVSKESQYANQAQSSVVFNTGENVSSTEIRQKLSSILHFEKKYKYYCKKHNVLYLIEKTRRKSRELSKKSRDYLINSFRSLDLMKSISNNTHLSDPPQLLAHVEVEFNDDGGNSFDQSTLDSDETECKIQRIYVTSNENEMNTYLAQSKENIRSNNQSANKVSLPELVCRYILCDEDSDYDEGYTEDEECYENSKDEDFILTRSPGGTSIIMKKIEDSRNVSYYEDWCTHHSCALKCNFKNNSCNYDSSFDED